MRHHRFLKVSSAICVVLLGGLIVFAQEKPGQEGGERTIKEADVPKAALDALKALAGKAAFTELAEETEHGHTFYEGSWTGPNGNVDALVTASGDLVELEEITPSDKVPASVRAEAAKTAGDAKVEFEKKTMVLYEIHYKKDGKGHEMIFTPDARQYHEEPAAKDEDDDDDDAKAPQKNPKDKDDDDD